MACEVATIEQSCRTKRCVVDFVIRVHGEHDKISLSIAL
jgi:hypothetical protein